MDKKQREVGDFLRKMGHELPDEPTPPMRDRIWRARIALLEEEVGEVTEALLEDDLAQVGGELCDVIYAAYAIAEACGVDLDPFWSRVQAANMEKQPNPDGKPVKGPGWQAPDLEEALEDARTGATGVREFYPAWFTTAQAAFQRLQAQGKITLLDMADSNRIMARHLPG